MSTLLTILLTPAMLRLLPLVLLALTLLVGCDSDANEPDPIPTPNLIIANGVPDQSGQDGSTFIQAISLQTPSVTNANAIEQTFFAYIHVRGREVIVTQNTQGDVATRYVVGEDGLLNETGQLTLPAGGFSANVIWASDTRAFVSLVFAGQIIEFNPQTMTQTAVIDLTALGIARNPANPDDTNPEPAVMLLRNGKLYVGLQQFFAPFANADGVDIAVFDANTLAFERVISTERSAGPGRYGYNQTMFVDEAGDIYVYCTASFGFVPGQKSGFLRIRNGATEFDPTYFLDVSALNVPVDGGQIGTVGGNVVYHNGFAYGAAEIPAGRSNPPDYVRDFNWQPVRFNLSAGTVEVLPLPPGNGLSIGVELLDGQILFGMGTPTATGLFRYDPATQQATSEPIVTTSGVPQAVLRLDN